jgi:membrane-bound metal-dependent hydrolase YbcI (DUF457 family)
MTKDFRHVGRLPTAPEAASHPATSVGPATIAQRVITRTLYSTAIALFLAGLWLLSGRPSPIPKEISGFLGLAFLLAAIFDIAAVQIFKRAWTKNSPEPES